MTDGILEFLIANCYAGQKRTGKRKQFVFLNGEEVWKGPYKQDKIDTIMERSAIFKSWKTPLVVHPLRVEGEWIVFPNITREYPIEKNFLNEESYSEYKYCVAERSIVDKMNNVLLKNKWIYDIPELVEACVHMWLLGVGDVGMFNVLIDQQKQLIHVIDYEEYASKTREGEVFYFSKDPAVKFNWYENVARHYGEVARRLERLRELSPDLSVKMTCAIELLNKHGREGKLSLDVKMKEVKEVTEKMKGLQVSNNGQMEWHGMFGSTITYSGYKMDVMKSGIQKYIRRGMVDKALYCGFEMFRLGEIGGNAAVTNLFNRIRIIAAEDVGVADFSVVIAVIDYVNRGERNPAILKGMIKALAECKKTRVGSHLCNVYKRPESREYARSKGILIDSDYAEEDEKFIEQHKNEQPFKDVENEDLKGCALIFYKRLLDRNFNAVTWWGFFEHYAATDNLKIKMRDAYYDGNKWRKSSRPISILFDVLDMFVDKNAMNVIKMACFSMAEPKPTKNKPNPRNDTKYMPVLSISAALFDVKYEYVSIPGDNSGLKNLLSGKYELEVDDYVIDKHTSEGAQKGKTRKDFVNEGAVVYPEDMRFHFDQLADVYMGCKKF